MFGNPRVGSFVDPTSSVECCMVVWLGADVRMLREYAHDVGY